MKNVTDFLIELNEKWNNLLYEQWGEEGPENTQIEYHGVWSVNGRLLYVQQYKNNNGFEIFYQSQRFQLDELEQELEDWINGDND